MIRVTVDKGEAAKYSMYHELAKHIKYKNFIVLKYLITPGGGAAPSTPSWTLRRCRGVAVVGFLQNNTGRGVGVSRRLRRESKNWLFGKMKMNMNLSPSCVWANVSRDGIYQAEFELFLTPSPGCAEFGKSGLRWLSLSGVELFLPPVQIALSSVNQD
ncbi:hypothetical protein AgCh_006918 [Apium graveolens]